MKFTSSHKKVLCSTEERWRRIQIGDLTVAAFAPIGQITVRSTTTCPELCWVLIRSRLDKLQDLPDLGRIHLYPTSVTLLTKKFFAFRANHYEFGLPVKTLINLIRQPTITRLPNGKKPWTEQKSQLLVKNERLFIRHVRSVNFTNR